MPPPGDRAFSRSGVKYLDMSRTVKYVDAVPAAEITSTQRLATALLGRDVHEWIAQERRDGRSWRGIAHRLKYETDGQVDVSHETVRGWASEVAA